MDMLCFSTPGVDCLILIATQGKFLSRLQINIFVVK